jgi:DNA-binding response OmpR family regulator
MVGLFKPKKSAHTVKILVVDDEPDFVDMIKTGIKSYQYDVITAVNGREALEIAQNEKPDLILLDIKMPIMDGYEMLKRLRNHQNLKGIAVIMVTKFFQPKDIAFASSYGIADYVVKPFNLTDLVEKIENTLQNKNLTQSVKTIL